MFNNGILSHSRLKPYAFCRMNKPFYLLKSFDPFQDWAYVLSNGVDTGIVISQSSCGSLRYQGTRTKFGDLLSSLNLIPRSLSLFLSLTQKRICHPPISGRSRGPGSWGFALHFLHN